MNKLPISVCILVKNAQKTIKQCLDSLSDFDEIILLDNNSDDKTLEIANEYSQVRIYTSEFIGFGALKNLCISYAKNDWIFSIDSDEVLEIEALTQIKQIFLDSKNVPTNLIISLPRKNLYKNQWIKACGWSPDFVKRIFNKTYTRFNENLVHESVISPSDCIHKELDGYIRHYAFDSIELLLDKMQRYTSLFASQQLANPLKKTSMLKAIGNATYCFIRNYFLKKGIFFGYKGFVISVCNALGVFFKYAKLYEERLKKPQSVSLIITTYNQKERLKLVLDSVLNLNPAPNEVLIADDGSKEDTKELVDSYRQSFKAKNIAYSHIWQQDNGFELARIRNRAIAHAQSEYIIIIDGDMILDSSFVAHHLQKAQRGVFLQGSRIILNQNISNKLLDSFKESNAFKMAFSQGGFKAKKIQWLSNIVYSNSTISAKYFKNKDFIKGIRGCNMSFYKCDCEAINGFNCDFIGWGREDSEFVARFLFNGGVLRRLKFAGIAYHIYHAENSRQMLEANHRIYTECVKNKLNYCKNGLKKINNNI